MNRTPEVFVDPEAVEIGKSEVGTEAEDTSKLVADILRSLDEAFDLKAMLRSGAKTFKSSPRFEFTDSRGNDETSICVVLSSTDEARYRPKITILIDGKPSSEFEFGGRYIKRLDQALAGLPVEAPDAKKEKEGSVPHSLIEIEVHRSVPNFRALEVLLHHDPQRELYVVPNDAEGTPFLYCLERNQRQGYTVSTCRLGNGQWNQTKASWQMLDRHDNTGLALISPEEALRLLSTSVPTKLKVTVKALGAEPEIAPETEVQLLSAAELASLFSAGQNREHWTAVFSAIAQKTRAVSLEEKGVKMSVEPADEVGKVATLSFEVAGDDALLWEAMKTDKAVLLENQDHKKLLIRFLKEYGVKGFGFRGRKPAKPDAEEPTGADDSANQEDGLSRQDMMNLMGGMGAATAGEDLAPENKEDHESQAVEAFIDKFNAEVLRDIKGQILRIDNSEATKILMEKLFLEAEDLVIESCEGLVEIDFSATGIKKVKFWLGPGLRKGKAIREKWYIFRANQEAILNEISSGEVEFDLEKFAGVLNEEDERL